MAQVHYYRGAYTNFSDIRYTWDGEHIYRGAYTNFSDILFSYDGIVPLCLILLMAQ